jgi:xanthine dehydrogenase YagR molybdenum-binding subunit
VTAIDASDALQLPGVVDVLDARTLPRPMRAGGLPLFGPAVLYPYQPVAAVCAESRAAALAGAAAVRVTYDTAPFAATFDAATASDAPVVRGSRNLLRGSPTITERGDVTRALAQAEVIVTREYRTPSALHSPMEPHATVAEWEGDRLTLWESTQGIYRVRDEVANGLALPRSHVRVIKDYMGGGFGGKNNAGAQTFVAALFARRTGRAVRCVVEREAEQADGGHRAPSRQVVTLGATRDGRLQAIDVVTEIPLGATGWEGSVAAIYREMYACENVRTHESFAYAHTQPMMAFRAPGHVEGAFGLERTMDVLARELGIDPLALRLANFAERDQDKDRPYSANGLRRCYEEGARRFGWTGPARLGGDAAAERSGGTSTRRVRRGVGLAACVWGAGGGPPAYATVRLNSDATVDVLSGTQDLGTGSRTILAQIAAESLGARVGDVRVVLGDTERTPYAGNSWGSMTTASVGPAVRLAAEEARRTLLDAASELLECHPGDLTASESVIATRDGARRLTFAEVTKKLGNVMIMGQGSRGPNPSNVALASFGVQFAEVEVDVETGVVRVLRITAAHDAGRIINPLLAESQLEGGILQGLGFALFEERHLDPHTGRPVNPSLHSYKLPTMADVPVIDAFCVAGSDPVANHVGARGLAEPPIIPTAPAIANAVADALGVELSELPLTPWRVLAALGPR